MGVSGLLTLLRSIQKPCHLRDFRGKTVAVDAYGWLHRGAVACAIELATGKPTTKFVDFAMHRVRMLKYFGVTPYIVFDGDRLPSKAATENGRAERRHEAKSAGLELLRVGKPSLAYQELQKAVDITPEMAKMFIEALKNANVRYVVAPYEADAQMVYLERKGIVDAIVSEDSDLLVFGANCLLTKLDQYGECVMFNRKHFTACREVNLTGWSTKEFRTMAILSGCDYLEGIHKMGLKTAHRLVRKYRTIERVIRGAMFEGKFRIPPNYQQDFTQAENTFLYQWVFCPEVEHLVHFSDLPHGVQADDMPYVGACVEAEIAQQVAEGELNPVTKKRIITSDTAIPPQKTPLEHNATQAVANKPKDSGKPIDTFFKPKRIPLAELDPNSFAPSESQQRLLASQQNQQSWASTPVPAPDHEGHERIRRSYSAPTHNPITVQNPPKRRRLCEDSPTKEIEHTERSKFFGGGRSSRKIRSAKNKASQFDFNIYSDDSVEGAMVEMTSTQSAKTVEVYRDDAEVSKPTIQDDLAEDVNVGGQLNEGNEMPKSKVGLAGNSKKPEQDHGQSRVDESDDIGESYSEDSPFSTSLKLETKALRERTSLASFVFAEGNTELNNKSSKVLSSLEESPPATDSLSRSPHEVPSGIPLETPRKSMKSLSTSQKQQEEHGDDAVVFESPPKRTPAIESASSLELCTPAWLPDDSGYASQLESFTVDAKGSEDCVVPASDDSTRDGEEVPFDASRARKCGKVD